MSGPIRVLFLREANAARSQMAKALLRHVGGTAFDFHGAGIDPRPLHPLAVGAMAEIGLDLSGQRMRHLNDYLDARFDHVITLCGRDEHFCPDFPHDKQTLHWACEDPAEVRGSEAECLDAFRRARDEFRDRIESWLATSGTVERMRPGSGQGRGQP